MDGNRSYLRCSVGGRGVFTDHPVGAVGKFNIIDISASGIRISAKREFSPDDTVQMSIAFSGYLREKEINVKAKVVRKVQSQDGFEYGLKFIDLDHKEKVEIDEIMNQSCSREHQKALSNCDYDNCTFLK
ncbi:MAG: PilZ domain-containing protein [Bacillota bacterium]